jgi:hypothetical protein
MPAWLFVVPALLQAFVIAVDEGYYHHRRGLPRWERLGHPLDTATVALALSVIVLAAPRPGTLAAYVALAAASCLFITKDEPVHARLCTAGEHWLHALLFVLHPLVFVGLGMLWWQGGHAALLGAQLGLTLVFLVYQVVYWNVFRPAEGASR